MARGVLRASFVEICEIYAKPPFPISLPDYHWICQPHGVQHPSDQTSSFKLLNLFGNELLPLQGLLSNLMLDASGMWAESKVALDYLPGNTRDVRWLPRKHIDIRPQEGNERAFLFVIKGGADGERTISAIQPCQDLLHSR